MSADSEGNEEGLEFASFNLTETSARRLPVSPDETADYQPISSVISLESFEIGFEPDEGDLPAPRSRPAAAAPASGSAAPSSPDKSAPATGARPAASGEIVPTGGRTAREPLTRGSPADLAFLAAAEDDELPGGYGSTAEDGLDGLIGIERAEALPDLEPSSVSARKSSRRLKKQDGPGNLFEDEDGPSGSGDFGGLLEDLTYNEQAEEGAVYDEESASVYPAIDSGAENDIPSLSDLLSEDEDILGAIPVERASQNKRAGKIAAEETQEEEESDEEEEGSTDSSHSSRRRRKKRNEDEPRARPGRKKAAEERPERVPLKLRGRITDDRFAPREGVMRRAPEDKDGFSGETDRDRREDGEPDDLELLSGRGAESDEEQYEEGDADSSANPEPGDADFAGLLGEFGAGDPEAEETADDSAEYPDEEPADFSDDDDDAMTIPAGDYDSEEESADADAGIGGFLSQDLDLGAEFSDLTGADESSAHVSRTTGSDSLSDDEFGSNFGNSFGTGLDLGRLDEEEEDSFSSGSGKLFDEDDEDSLLQRRKNQLPPAGEAFIRTIQRWRHGMPTRSELTQATRDWLELLRSIRPLLKEYGLGNGANEWLRRLRSMVGMEHTLNPFSRSSISVMPPDDGLESATMRGIGSAMPGISGADDWGDNSAVPAGAAQSGLTDSAFSAADASANDWEVPGAEVPAPDNSWGASPSAATHGDLSSEFSDNNAEDAQSSAFPATAQTPTDPDMPPDDILPDEQDFSFSTADMLMQDGELGLDDMDSEFAPQGSAGASMHGGDESAQAQPGITGWLRQHTKFLRKWGLLFYRYLDHYADFQNNWWKMVDFLALIILAMAGAAFLSYFLWYNN